MRREGLFDANRNGSGEADGSGGEEVKWGVWFPALL